MPESGSVALKTQKNPTNYNNHVSNNQVMKWNENPGKFQNSLEFSGKTNGKYYVLKQSYLTKNAKRQ